MVGLVSMVCMLGLWILRGDKDHLRALGRSAGDALKGNMFSGATFLIIPRAPIVSEVEVWSQPGAKTRSRTVVCVKCR